MARLIIQGGQRLQGQHRAPGNKNAALPMLAACVLTDEPVVLQNVPLIEDVRIMLAILEELGVQVELHGHTATLCARGIRKRRLDEALCRRVRSSILRMRASIDAERDLQTRAAECFQRALEADRVAPANRPAASYLLAELLRRLGRDDEAVRWYDDAMSNNTLPGQLRIWADEQKIWASATDDQ